MAKTNHRATLDVLPEQLSIIAALLPEGFFIVGSEALIGSVRLILEGAGVTENGKHLQLVVTKDKRERTTSLAAAPVKSTNG